MTSKKFKFNIIDALIILILIAAVAVLAYVFVFSDDTDVKGEEHTIEYTIEFTSVNGTFADDIKEGQSVTLETDRKINLGTVTAYEYGKCVKPMYNNETESEEYSVVKDNLIDMVVTFLAKAELDEWGYCIDDETYIAVNNSMDYIVGEFRCIGMCTAVKVID